MSKFNKKSKNNHWLPIKQFRFDTAKHPVIQSSRGRPACVLSTYMEKQMLEGLARILQCDEQTALRSAVYEHQQVQPYLRPSIIEGATALVDRQKIAFVSLTACIRGGDAWLRHHCDPHRIAYGGRCEASGTAIEHHHLRCMCTSRPPQGCQPLRSVRFGVPPVSDLINL